MNTRLTKLLLASVLAFFPASIASAVDLDLQWNDNSNNEQGFVMERQIDDGPWIEVGRILVDGTRWSDIDVPVGVILNYRVYAYNEFGTSPYSNVLIIDANPPAGPEGLTIFVVASAGAIVVFKVLILLFAFSKRRKR